MSTKTISKPTETPEVDVKEESEKNDKILSDAEIEQKVFQYGALISIALWAYIFIKGGNAVYFIIPAICISLTVLVLFVRYRKRKAHMSWVGESFREYKTEQFSHHD
ncbi:hypothetical protein [Candidatus Lokiarchaeum ossiferum]|uniref:hypothetical protein n=1 Tax=Candidatus Lokiarchaeum ossiferum TaxID=2951803 RepID=UPI00352D89B6